MKIKNLIILFSLLLNASQALAKNSEILIFDSKELNKSGLPKVFRDLSQFGLNAIASAQFSEKELQQIRKKYPNEKILIVDLRREPHGIVNGEAVSWREQFDKSESNNGKTSAEIIANEKLRFNAAKKDGEIVVNLVVEKDKKNGWFEEVSPHLVKVEQALTEEELAKKYGFEYKRFAIQDHARPSEKTLNDMVQFIKNLPQDKKIYVHCAGGKGRTTTFLTLYDIVKNGDKLQLKEILERQHDVGGSNLYKAEDEGGASYRSNLAKERIAMIEKFYSKEKGNQ